MMKDNKNREIPESYNDSFNGQDGYGLPDNYEPEKKSNAPLIVSIIIAAVVVLAAAGFFTYVLVFSDNSPLKQTEAATPVTVAATAEETVSPTTAPAPTENKAVQLLIMPSLTGLSEADAYKKLNDEGIKFKVTREFSEDVALNHVISQNPQSGESISRADEAVIYISRGKENEIIPNTTSPKKEDKKDKEETTTAPKKQSSTSGGSYILDGSDSRFISKSELNSLSRQELNLALNEIYARHGRIFKSAEISAYFNSQSWYNGTISAADFDEDAVMNDYEKYNIALISSYQAEKGYR